MSSEDLYPDSEQPGDKSLRDSQKSQDESDYQARRRLEERLEASRIKKQTQDYDFDLN